jgi:hypothetical protein
VAKKISLQRLSKRQIRAYIHDNDCSLDPSLNSETPDNLLFVFNETYRCVNGKILAVSKSGTGNLYGSVNDWQTELEELVDLGKREPVHILYNQLPSQEQFIEEIPSLISNLARELEIVPSELDRTQESLLILDQAITRKNRQSYIDSSSKKILGSLIAYIGEVIRVAINGEWQIRQNSESGWEPVIISSNGTTSSFCIMVFDELYEAESSSFYDIALMLIEAHQQGCI